MSCFTDGTINLSCFNNDNIYVFMTTVSQPPPLSARLPHMRWTLTQSALVDFFRVKPKFFFSFSTHRQIQQLRMKLTAFLLTLTCERLVSGQRWRVIPVLAASLQVERFALLYIRASERAGAFLYSDNNILRREQSTVLQFILHSVAGKHRNVGECDFFARHVHNQVLTGKSQLEDVRLSTRF